MASYRDNPWNFLAGLGFSLATGQDMFRQWDQAERAAEQRGYKELMARGYLGEGIPESVTMPQPGYARLFGAPERTRELGVLDRMAYTQGTEERFDRNWTLEEQRLTREWNEWRRAEMKKDAKYKWELRRKAEQSGANPGQVVQLFQLMDTVANSSWQVQDIKAEYERKLDRYKELRKKASGGGALMDAEMSMENLIKEEAEEYMLLPTQLTELQQRAFDTSNEMAVGLFRVTQSNPEDLWAYIEGTRQRPKGLKEEEDGYKPYIDGGPLDFQFSHTPDQPGGGQLPPDTPFWNAFQYLAPGAMPGGMTFSIPEE